MIFLGQCRNIICTSWKYFYLSIHEESFLLSPLSYFEYVIHKFTNFSNDCISVCNQETSEWMFLFYKVNYFKFIVGHDSSSGQFPRREQFQTVSRRLLALISRLYLLSFSLHFMTMNCFIVHGNEAQATDHKGWLEGRNMYGIKLVLSFHPSRKSQDISMTKFSIRFISA